MDLSSSRTVLGLLAALLYGCSPTSSSGSSSGDLDAADVLGDGQVEPLVTDTQDLDGAGIDLEAPDETVDDGVVGDGLEQTEGQIDFDLDLVEEMPWQPLLPDCLTGDHPPGCAALPNLVDWVCPEGWLSEPIEVVEGIEVDACRPPPRVSCEGSFAQFSGDTTCQRIGLECPSDGARFHDESVLTALSEFEAPSFVYVDGQASEADADGSLGHPFTTIGAALLVLPNVAIVAIAPGTYDGQVTVDSSLPSGESLAIIGACPAQTVLSAPSSVAVFVRESDRAVLISNLTIERSDHGIAAWDLSQSLSVVGLILDEIDITGIDVIRSERVIVTDLLGVDSGTDTFGNLINVQDVESLSAQRVVAAGLVGSAFRLTSGTADLSDIVVLDSGGAVGAWGDGQIDRLVTIGVRQGLFVSTSVNLSNFFASETSGPGIATSAITVYPSGVLDGNQVLIEGTVGQAILVWGHLDLADAVIRNTRRPEGLNWVANGVAVYEGSVAANRAVIVDGEDVGLYLKQSVSFVADDLVVARFRYGVHTSETDLTLRRFYSTGNVDAGLFIHEYSRAQLEDITVSNTNAGSLLGPYGYGIWSTTSELTLNRAVFENNRGAGLNLALSQLDATDLLVRDTQSFSDIAFAPYSAGMGIFVDSLGGTEIDNALFDGNRFVGLFVNGSSGSGTISNTEDCHNDVDDDDDDMTDCFDHECRTDELCHQANASTLSHIVITHTQLAECAELASDHPHTCGDADGRDSGGMGLVVTGDIEVELSDFLLAHSERVGLAIGAFTQLMAHRGHIRDNAIGVFLADPEYPLDNLYDEVFIYDNGEDVSRTGVTLPNPEDLIAGP